MSSTEKNASEETTTATITTVSNETSNEQNNLNKTEAIELVRAESECESVKCQVKEMEINVAALLPVATADKMHVQENVATTTAGGATATGAATAIAPLTAAATTTSAADLHMNAAELLPIAAATATTTYEAISSTAFACIEMCSVTHTSTSSFFASSSAAPVEYQQATCVNENVPTADKQEAAPTCAKVVTTSQLIAPTTTAVVAAATPVATITASQSAPSLPQATTTTANAAVHLPFTASEPAFSVELRRDQQQRKIRSYHEAAKQSAVTASTSISGAINKCVGTISASASPSMNRKSSDTCTTRRVSFPKSDRELVTGYLEPVNPWEHVYMVKNISEIVDSYKSSCYRHETKPLQIILDQLRAVDLNMQLRKLSLSLKTTKLSPNDCEALEEVFKRVKYKCIDISSCELEEKSATALFEMISFYEATNELDVSFNSRAMDDRGWGACATMVAKSQSLQVLNAGGNPMKNIDGFAKNLSTSNLHTLKLEHCGLRGILLSSLCFDLRRNNVLKELWLAYNDIDAADMKNIGELLQCNHYLELLDISNNNIRDDGLWQLVAFLIIQSNELEHRSLLQRSAAIDNDDSLSPEATAPAVELNAANSGIGSSKVDAAVSSSSAAPKRTGSPIEEDTDDDAFEMVPRASETETLVDLSETTHEHDATSTTQLAVTTATATVEADNDGDDDTEDTTVKSSTPKHAPVQTAGQSMLDKLLSMNSEGSSSSEDGASNLSTDTVAACCSEDTSIISDDIFDTVTSNSTHTKAAHTMPTVAAKLAPAPAPAPATYAAVTAAGTGVLTKAAVQQTSAESDAPFSDLISISEAITGDNSNSNTNSNSDTNNSNSLSTASTLNNNANNNMNNNINNNEKLQQQQQQQDNQHAHLNASAHLPIAAAACHHDTPPSGGIFEVTAEESDCFISGGASAEVIAEQHTLLLQHAAAKAFDVNKNTKEDYDDTHSMDSAFESASEGDISRHLPEDFSRLSASFESTRLDDNTKELLIETATIATESTECLMEAAATPNSTPTPPTPPLTKALLNSDGLTHEQGPAESGASAATLVQVCDEHATLVVPSTAQQPLNNAAAKQTHEKEVAQPKVTIAADSLMTAKHKDNESSHRNPITTPPPPSTSPGGASLSLRRTESSGTIITPSTRNRSQSSDSLCSDNSLEGSISSDYNFSTSTQINERLAKNDTLTRQQRQPDAPVTTSARAPCGLKALAVWNNNLTKESGSHIAALLTKTYSLELLNIGKNCLSNDFMSLIKEPLARNTTLTTLGLQSAHLSAKGIDTLISVLPFGGNSTLQRIDIRGNKLEAESLSTLAEALKSNTTVTQIDIDDEPKRLSFEKLRIVPFVSITAANASTSSALQDSVGSDEHKDYVRQLEIVRSMCFRNEKTQAQLLAEKSANVGGANKRRGGYYVGSRKISLTCHSRPLIESAAPSAVSTPANAKLEAKRKTGGRLRSPAPSPPTVSPSSSPNRNRFQVIRVAEVSPLTSPLAQTPSQASTHSAASSRVAIPTVSVDASYSYKMASTSLPSSSSMPSMATITSSTQSVKRLSVSPRSRFLVSKIYEDPRVPICDRSLPPITPPIYLPPTPMVKHSSEPELVPAAQPANAAARLQAEATPQPVEHTCNSTSTNTNTNNNNTTNQDTNSTNAKETVTVTTTAATQTAPITATTAPTGTTAQTNTVTCTSLSPLSSSNSSSSSSSSSTSPASLTSSSSTASASSSSSFTPLGSSVGSDHSDNAASILPTATSVCPIAVFSDNDITLTKSSGHEALSCVATAGGCYRAAGDVEEPSSGQSTPQQRTRKVGWMPNPSVDKLMTLFQKPGGIFQRSSSPEQRSVAGSPAANQGTNIGESTSSCGLPLQQQQNALVPSRKQSPSSWTKLGTDLLSASGADGRSTVVTTAAAMTEQSRSFMDAASRQFRDLWSWQNLSFGNESNMPTYAAAASAGTAAVAADSATGGNGSAAVGGASPEHDATLIPKEMKQEIKENISPEHTINEEALNSLQMLTCQSYSGAAALLPMEAPLLPLDLKASDELKESTGSSSATAGLEEVCTTTANNASASAAANATTTQIT